MTRAEYNTIFNILDNIENREKRYCKEYCKLNPADKSRRERDKDLFNLAICQVRTELRESLSCNKVVQNPS